MRDVTFEPDEVLTEFEIIVRKMSNEDFLAAWDAGHNVYTCTMGGITKAYEQCIHLVAMEVLRAMVASPPVGGWEIFDTDESSWAQYRLDIEKAENVKAVIAKLDVDHLGLTGAQWGAAVNVASVYARNGYAKGALNIPSVRIIKINKNFDFSTVDHDADLKAIMAKGAASNHD